MMRINPLMSGQITRVVICLVLAALFAIALERGGQQPLPAFCRRNRHRLLSIVASLGPLLIWLGRDHRLDTGGQPRIAGLAPGAADLSAIKSPGLPATT